jgi:membrane protein insertase Oxa1/YidC/SpoIIIJ
MRRYSLSIALVVTTIALILFLGFISWLHLTSTHNMAIKQAREAYFQQLNKEQSTDAAQRAWKRLQSKHGYPAAVIYEPGKTPYYINKSGQRCRFV